MIISLGNTISATYVSKKIVKSISIIFRSRFFLSSTTKLTFYYTSSYPYWSSIVTAPGRPHIFQVNTFEIAKFMFYYRNNLLTLLLLNLFVTNSQIHNYGTRTASNYRTHLCRTNLKQFTILYQGPKIWNSLPVSVTRSSNLLSFKTKMQEFLLK